MTACLQAGTALGLLSVRGRAFRRETAFNSTVPLQGHIAAGFSPDETGVPSPKGRLSLGLADLGVTLRPGAFAMRVQGDSMVEAHIHDGDIALLEPGCPQPGDIVAAAHEGCLLLKRLVVVGRVPYLKAENSVQPGLVRALDKPIHGIFRGLLRFDCMPPRSAEQHRSGVKYAPAPSRRVPSVAHSGQSRRRQKLSTRSRIEPR